MSNISTYEDLEKRIRAIERRLQVEGIIKSQEEDIIGKGITEETNLLYDAANGFVELSGDANIYEFIAEQFSKLSNNSFVIINSFDKSSYSLIVRAVHSPQSTDNSQSSSEYLNKIITEKTGRSFVGTVFELSELTAINLLKGKLIKAEDGLYELFFNTVPRPVCTELEQILDIKSSYSIGIVWKGELSGNAIILSNKTDITGTDEIEKFAELSAIAIQRSQTEELLKEKKGIPVCHT